jgi:hypothetical protein
VRHARNEPRYDWEAMFRYRQVALAAICSSLCWVGVASAAPAKGGPPCVRKSKAHHRHRCPARRKPNGPSATPNSGTNATQPTIRKELCAAASVPTAVPSGDGWIVGGVYLDGGPFPGIYECLGTAQTVEVFAVASGTLATTVHVPARESYSIVLPAGSYTLQAAGCHGTATVVAGHATSADTVCNIP